jgi:hypothetical protein
VYGIGICKNAPVIEWEKMKEDNEIMAEVVQYLDSIVNTINPGIDTPITDQHPCQKSHDELNDDLQDYIELINKLQHHTQYSPSYCLRRNREGQYCRFGTQKKT